LVPHLLHTGAVTPAAFLAKWRAAELKERSAAQTHFNDLCALLGLPDPITADPKGEEFCFEKGATKATGGQGWADVWKRGCFGWEYKGRHADLNAALRQLLQYAGALENPPLLITCDLDRIQIRTNFQNYVAETITLLLDDLADATRRDLLRRCFTDPESLRPRRTRTDATKDAAAAFAALAGRLATRGVPAREVARFTDRMVFCLFADDVGLLPKGLLDDMLRAAESHPANFPAFCGELFGAMARPGGGIVAFKPVAWFNGGLFDTPDPPPALTRPEIADLRRAAEQDWSHIDPAIFGTLFEGFLNPEKRGQIGAFYTDPAQIMQVLRPVLIAPLEAEWEAAKAAILAAKPGTRGRRAAAEALARFFERLRGLRVLDPACGSGNFLYLALQALKDLEKRARVEAEALGLPPGLALGVGPENVLGIERDEYAAELARLVVWIGEIQWMRRNGFSEARDPILRPLDTIACRDALLNADGTEAEWPAAECIVGNPPFLGDKMMRAGLGRDYLDNLRATYAGRVPGGADLVCFWFEKGRAEIAAGRAMRAGLVATNSIRGGANRRVLDRITDTAGQAIFDAWADEGWISDGAAVRVSLICFGRAPSGSRHLNGREVQTINADLTAAGADLTRARALTQNAGIAFNGIQKTGPFDIDGTLARSLLQLPVNPNGRTNSDVVRPWWNGLDVTRRNRDFWIIDFGVSTSEADAALYEAPFEYVLRAVKPVRDANSLEALRRIWWRLWRPRGEMRQALTGFARFIATPEVSKHRVFVFIPAKVIPDKNLIAIARDDDTTFGILHSRFHEAWALRLGTSLEDRPRYTPTTTFETFPFPEGLTPDRPAATYAADPRAIAIAAAAARLNILREAWLNPPDLVERVPEVVPGFPDRLLPRSPAAAATLAKRTLTALYNERPRWLADAHAALDAAVAAAYGWPADIPAEEALARLLALNLARA
jgi:type II restriction/modification system DNA methylase subunit YeeA